MSCDLSVGLTTLGCKDNAGGVVAVYLANKENVASLTSATGTITVITMVATMKFYKFLLPKNTGDYTESIKANVTNGTVYYEQVSTMSFRKMQAATRNIIKVLAVANLVAIIQDNNGNYWYLGEQNGVDVTDGNATTGTNIGDKNGYALTITGMEPNPAQQVDPTIIAGLL